MPETNILKISNVISLHKANLSQDIIANIKLKFSVDNPRFAENRRLGYSNYATSQTIDLYQENGSVINFPRGVLKDLSQVIPNISIDDQTTLHPVDLPFSEIQLRPYQKKAVEALLQRNQGILVAPPGSGKTVMAIYICLNRGQRTLVLCHTKDLKEQWRDRFQRFTGTEPGLVDDSHFDLEAPVIIGMVQSLNAKKLTSEFLNSFGCIILDEAQHCPAFTFERLINQFSARYRYGLTATPERRDGLTFMLHAVLGPVIHEVKREELFSEGQIIKPVIRAVETGFYMPVCDDYRSLIDAVTRDAERNHLILKHLIREAKDGHFCLVLSERISHIEDLSLIFTTLCSDIRSEILTSRIPKAERKAILRDAEEGDVRVVFATKLADEGLDVPRLDRLFLTCPVRNPSKIKQQVGRIMRTFPGKHDAVVYDFADELVGLAVSQYRTRKTEAYVDFEVEEIQYEHPN